MPQQVELLLQKPRQPEPQTPHRRKRALTYFPSSPLATRHTAEGPHLADSTEPGETLPQTVEDFFFSRLCSRTGIAFLKIEHTALWVCAEPDTGSRYMGAVEAYWNMYHFLIMCIIRSLVLWSLGPQKQNNKINPWESGKKSRVIQKKSLTPKTGKLSW